MLMRNNTKLYRNIRLLRLQTKTSISQPREHVDLKTLAEATINLAKDSEASVKDTVMRKSGSEGEWFEDTVPRIYHKEEV
jgi:hypothetical protein